jgi:hypothetical protein
MIKYQIKEGQTELLFHVNDEGNLVIEANGQPIEVNHLVAVELTNIIQSKLYEHAQNTGSIFQKLFR